MIFLFSGTKVTPHAAFVKAKILNTNDGKVSLSMKALEDIMEKPQEEEEAEAIEYSSNETAGTSLGDLLSKFKL